MELTTPIVVVLLAVAAACVSDVRKFKVYNALTLPLIATGLLYHGVFEGSEGVAVSMSGLFLGFGALFFPYIVGAMGAGDVKLAAGVGAWLGAGVIAPVLAVGLLATAIYSLVALFRQRRLRDAWVNLKISVFQAMAMGRHFMAVENHESLQELVKQPSMRKRLIPFSVMLGIGVIVTVVGQLLGFGLP